MKRTWCILGQSFLRSRYNHQRRFSCSAGKAGPVRVRFAPSPTGLLHLGGFRTALLNYLFALKHDGKFILRIEDTDQTRLVPNALQMIETDLEWLGIGPSEGPSKPGQHGPYIQSHRLPIYHENLSTLVDSGHAYECFCTEKRLELMKREAVKSQQRPGYDNKCRDLSRDEVKRKKAAGEKFCVRFKLKQEHLTLKDLVHGDVEFDLTGTKYEGDPVIVKTDGYPTYHFANVVDDHYMEISHVLRGVEWQISTPKHLQMYSAFRWDPPKYAHLPIVLNRDGSKLSKRQGDISISHYRSQTYYPIALSNFVTKSGGGFAYHKVDKLLDLKELAETFDLNYVNIGGCRLDFTLLEQLNQIEFKARIENQMTSTLRTLDHVMTSTGELKAQDYPIYFKEKILKWCPERASKVKDLFSSEFEYIWSQPNPSLLSKVSTDHHVLQEFIKMCDLELTEDLDATKDSSSVTALLEQFMSAHKLKQKSFLKDLRIILCGITKGPPIVEVLTLFGKKTVTKRLTTSLDYITASHPTARQQ